MQFFNVVIVGAGPAGLISALELSKAGCHVAVIEKIKDVREVRRACSQQLILDEEYEGDIVTVNESGFYFKNADFTVPYKGDLIPLYDKYYHSPKNHCLHFARDNGKTPFSYKFQKTDLLGGMYDLCEASGVTFFMHTRASKISDSDAGAEVTILHKDRTSETLFCKKLILAEGVNANLANRLGMNSKRFYMAASPVVKQVYRGVTGIAPNSWNLYYGKAYYSNSPVIIGPGFDGTVEVTATGGTHVRPLEVLSNFTTKSPMAEFFANAQLVDAYGCCLKARMPMSEPCKGNVIVLGDAAAMIETEVQGAFLCGYYGAHAVIRELQGEDGWNDYTKWWLSAFEFNRADYMRVAQGYGLVPTYTDDELDYLFALVEDVTMPGTYSQYRTPALMWDTIFSRIDIVMEDNHALYDKICNVNKISLNTSLTASK
ncbi:MAG: FAD-dependent monooxygenase [Oscillospiraceae bacterium]|nr:FAD-dependent monooxygenase [Oscillospiraceae bacterium]